jgi:hypothetical protein
MAKPDAAESTAPADGCRESHKDVDKVIKVILSEFEGDTSAFFESIRSKEGTAWQKDSREAVAVRKFARASGS